MLNLHPLLLAGTVYTNPNFKDLPVDWCLEWETNCGKPAAQYFCQLKNKRLVRFLGPVNIAAVANVVVNTSPAGGCKLKKCFCATTILPKIGATCNSQFHGCDTFKYIECA
jgi:hypothetical protein